MDYDDRLNILGLTRLSDRRIRGDLIEQFKILHGIDIVNFSVEQRKPAWQTHSSYNLRCGAREHNAQLERQSVKNCLARENFFTNRVTAPWNALSQDAVNAQTINSFKDYIDKKV